jgi:hypothetical protein
MTNKGLLVAALGLVLLGAGLLALNFPVFLDAHDKWGAQVECGTGYISNQTQAIAADEAAGTSNFVNECNSALAVRRAWTIPLVAIGSLILAGLLVELYRHAERTNQTPDRDNG